MRTDLAILTGSKVVSNTALRWIGPFLPTVERAFGAGTGTLTGIIGVCELGGLSTLATGPTLDQGRERTVFALGLATVSVSSLVALHGSVASFAVSFALLVLGVSNLTVAGHAWIGHRVPYRTRSRAIGVFEISWALSLLFGAPLIAVLIDIGGWRAPYLFLAGSSAIAAIVVVAGVRPGSGAPARAAGSGTLPSTAWAPMIASAATAAAGLGIFVVSGVWLDEVHGLSTGGLGVVAASFGLVELTSSGSVAGFGDRLGARRSVLAGLVTLLAGATTMAVSGDHLAVAITGLLVFLAGFEFAFVSSLTLVTEAVPHARGRAIGMSNAFGTLARGGSVFVSGQVYEAVGITGSVTVVCAAAVVAVVACVASRP